MKIQISVSSEGSTYNKILDQIAKLKDKLEKHKTDAQEIINEGGKTHSKEYKEHKDAQKRISLKITRENQKLVIEGRK